MSIIFCMSCWVTLSVFSNIQIQYWCSDQSRRNYSLYLYLGLGIAAVLFTGIRGYILVSSGMRQGLALHKKVMKALLYASLTKFYNRVPIGRILNRLSKDLR
jgi:ATP-binding cassette subfamily C (CFTR/MRP) protein 1